MLASLSSGLSSRNGLVRKATAAALRVPKWFHSFGVTAEDLAALPPVLVNSVPKSGTHLLAQIVAALPARVNYGQFLSSMTSSFKFRERTSQSVHRAIRRMLPGEIVRGHLFFDADTAAALGNRNVVHFFIYRDPRDVAVSGAHYVRSMNRWHKLHRYFRSAESIDEAIKLAILGLRPPVPGIVFPDIAQRFSRYRGWLNDKNCYAVRYEDLQSEARAATARAMAEFYVGRTPTPLDIDACTVSMLDSIAPAKSHTFRSGVKGGWRKSFSREHRQLFCDVAGQLLIDLGYENSADWVDAPETISS